MPGLRFTRPTAVLRAIAAVALAALVVIGVVVPTQPAEAVNYVACGDVLGPSGLMNSVESADLASQEATVYLTPGCTYAFPESAWTYTDGYGNKSYYDSAFYPIDGGRGKHLIIEGNGATITRAAGAGQFRFFDIAQLGNVTLRNLTLANGESKNGMVDGYVNIANAGQAGGAIENAGNLVLDGVTLSGNRSGAGENGTNGGTGDGYPAAGGGDGGAIINSGGLTVTNSTFVNNTTGPGGTGGDGWVNGGQGGDGGRGGAIYNVGSLSITASTFTINSTGNGGAGGGGIYESRASSRGSGGAIGSSGSVTITRSLFLNNNTEGSEGAEGGAIWMNAAGLVVENSTFVGNKAWRGGALHVMYKGSAAIRSSTFTGNDATGGGNYITGDVASMDDGSTMTFSNTLMAGNDAGQVDCNISTFGAAVTYSSLGGLMSDENNGCGTNTLIANPGLEALGSYGGTTSTRLPTATSPALGAGAAGQCLAVDQRGTPRPPTGCDIGAVERVAVSTPGAVTGPTVVSQNVASTYATTASAGGSALEYSWSVSGLPATISSPTVASPSITFTSFGTATVSLSVRVAGSSAAESTAVASLTVKVPPAGNTAPTVAWTAAPTYVNEGDTTRFEYSVSDPQGDVWTVSSGYPSCGANGTVTGSGVTSTGGWVDCLLPNGPTTSAVSVRVQDVWDSATSSSISVSIAEVAPTIVVTGLETVDEGTVATYTYTVSEPGSDIFTPSTTCSGGGASKVGGSDTYTGSGHNTVGSLKCKVGNGPSTAVITVTANGGSGSFSSAVSNLAPTIAVTGEDPADENGATTDVYNYSLNAADLGDQSTLTLVAGSASCGGDGIGTVIYVDMATISCRFVAGPASALVTAQVKDADGATSTGGGLTVQVSNVAPTVTIGQPTSAVNEGGTASYALTATDPGNDTLTVTAPQGCTVSNLNTATAGKLTARLDCVYADGPATVSRSVSVSDGTSSTPATITDQEVLDVAPALAVSFPDGAPFENTYVHINVGALTDPGTETPERIIVHWGDGTMHTINWPLDGDLGHYYQLPGNYSVSIDVIDEDGTHYNASGIKNLWVRAIPPTGTLTAPEFAHEGAISVITYTAGQANDREHAIDFISCGRTDDYKPLEATNVVVGDNGGSFECAWGVGVIDQQVRIRISDIGGSSEMTAIVKVAGEPVKVTWTSIPAPVLQRPDTVYRFGFHAEDPSPIHVALGGGVTMTCGASATVVSTIVDEYGFVVPGVVFDQASGDGYIDCVFPRSGISTIAIEISDYRLPTIATLDVTVANEAPVVILAAPTDTIVEAVAAVFSYSGTDASGEAVWFDSASCGSNGTLLGNDASTFSCVFHDGPASHSAAVTLSDGKASTTMDVAVNVVNAAPASIMLTGDGVFEPGEEYTLEIGDTVDAGDDNGIAWTVHWGDGESTSLTSRTPAPTHVYANGDPRTITVDVTDEDGVYPALGSKALLEADHIAPVLTLPADSTFEANQYRGLNWAGWPRSAVDARDGILPITCDSDITLNNLFYVGSTTHTCWATDLSGNRAEATFTVTVTDTVAPSFYTIPDTIPATSSAGATVSWPTEAYDLVSWNVQSVCDTVRGQLFAFGSHTVHCTATDEAGNVGVLDFTFEVGDYAGPRIVQHHQIDIAASSRNGDVVTYVTPTAWDTIDGGTPVSCLPVSGTVFPYGDSVVSCESFDSAGNRSQSDFGVSVKDRTPPVIAGPGNIATAITSWGGWDGDGAVVSWDISAKDNISSFDGGWAVNCDHGNGYFYPAGVTTVTCESTDQSRNQSIYTFTITVQDMDAPVVTVPADTTLEATDADGETIDYSGVSAWDAKDGFRATTCVPASGSVFAVGETTVTCSASDPEGNVGTAGFVVSITDTTSPVVIAPADFSAEATGTTTSVTFTGHSASDLVDGVGLPVACEPGVLGVGDTRVTCSATDAHGNTGAATLTVSVIDTTAPVVTADNVTVPATSPDGAIVEFMAAATDALGSPSASCLPESGSLFAPASTTTVTCSATDLAGNTGTGTFAVTVDGTVISDDAEGGDTEIEIAADVFEAGNYVVIGAGRADQEVRYVGSLGSIILAAPIAFAHAAGTPVSAIAPPQGDVTAPTITVDDADALTIGVPASAVATCTDAGVGVEFCALPVFDTSTIGSRSVTMRAWDFNGNLRTLSIDYTVVAAPVDPDPGAGTPGDETPGGGTPDGPGQSGPIVGGVAGGAAPGANGLAGTGIDGIGARLWLALLLLALGAGTLADRRDRRRRDGIRGL